MTLGHVGLIGLLYRTRRCRRRMRTSAAVGQMALTNYLAQSLICMFLFTGAGLALYGQLERHELYYVVAAIWIVQLIWSPLWLRRFRFGPAEWLWRSLTYWQLQPCAASARELRRPAFSSRAAVVSVDANPSLRRVDRRTVSIVSASSTRLSSR